MDNPCLPGLMRWLAERHRAPVERIDTHISTVLLVGEHAYKLKKPVRLPFLDFSTVEQRRHFCEEELRINQRTAPLVYLDVLPVTGSVGSPGLGSTPSAIDWVVHMRRFPTDSVLATLADTHRLQDAQVDALANHVATFHQTLPPLTSHWAPQKNLDVWALESCDEIATHPNRPTWLNAERQTALRNRLQHTLNGLRGWRQERQMNGHVRDCHGDLHLGNVVQWQGQVMAFDAIEFDADLRCIDVMNDAAFTFMDLHARDLHTLAWRFINRYVTHTGDFDGLRGLNLFTAYRALVRTKVVLLSGSPASEFSRYWCLAEQFLAPPRPPCLLVTMGLSGSGKSTVAQLLVSALAQQGVGAVWLRSDVERKRLHGLSPTARPADTVDLYAPQATELTYAHLRDTAHALLRAGHWVVVDAACLRRSQQACLINAAAQASALCSLVECVASPAHLRERIKLRQHRNNDASDATVEVLERQMASAEPPPNDGTVGLHRVVNDGSLADLNVQVKRLAQMLTTP